MKLKHLYLALSILGLCFTWYYNIQWFQTAENPSFLQFFADAQVNFAGKSFGADLFVVSVAFFVFMLSENAKLKIKYWWILIPLTFAIALAFTFPLYLYLRANKIEKNGFQSI